MVTNKLQSAIDKPGREVDFIKMMTQIKEMLERAWRMV